MSLPYIDQLLQEVKTLPKADLDALIRALEHVRFSTGQENNAIPNKLPDLNIVPTLLPTYIEYLIKAFVLSVARLYKDDFKYNPATKLTNNNGLNLARYYYEGKEGQYPRIVIKVQSASASDAFLSNLSPAGVAHPSSNVSQVSNEANVVYPVFIDILHTNSIECDHLASILHANFLPAIAPLREVGGFQNITMPTVEFAQKVREYQGVYLARLQFQINSTINWTETFTEKLYSNILIELTAVCKLDNENCNGITQIILTNIEQAAPGLIQYVEQRQQELEDKEGDPSC